MMIMAATDPANMKIVNNDRERQKHHHRQNRRPRSPFTDTLGRFQKFVSLFDGSPTVQTVLKRAFDAVFVADTAVAIAYCEDHTVDHIMDSSQAIFDRFLSWNQAGVSLVVDNVQILASSVLEYTIHIQKPSDRNKNGGIAHRSYLEARKTLVCTATLLDGKILSCIEKNVTSREGAEKGEGRVDQEQPIRSLLQVHQQQTQHNDSMDQSFSMNSTSSASSSGSEFCKGTGLEDVEQRGGSIFMIKNLDVTSITVITDQDGVHKDLELVELDSSLSPSGKVKASTDSPPISDKKKHGYFLLRDTTVDRRVIVFCRSVKTPSQPREAFFIDGRLPMFEKDEPVSSHGDDEFYPRYQFDQLSNQVYVWNGSFYERYMNASEDDDTSQQSSGQQLTADMVGFTTTGCETARDVIAHVSKKGGTQLLRAKIKVPGGEDPSLMICLTAIRCRGSNDYKKFAKLRIRRYPQNTATASSTAAVTTAPRPKTATHALQHQPHDDDQHFNEERASPINKVSLILNERSSFMAKQ